ncbi:hypothetical protein [Planococcus sp. 107-1]|uniref:hypothetical protein n=1 Tax=Planococcus sp. 107-1 TaxID=2908840 RepID=UPI001F31CA83|nr:hypothetical protein [Planococcus sp. 107-1]UJF27708.1 hypothetical protein L0M13_04400 [Planococcus sp. 107-1]
MNNRFFSSLALRNIKSNKTLYIPYLLSSIAIIMMFYLMASLLANQFVQQRSSALPTLFSLGVIVIAIFSVIFILYTNSFVIKKRKKKSAFTESWVWRKGMSRKSYCSKQCLQA